MPRRKVSKAKSRPRAINIRWPSLTRNCAPDGLPFDETMTPYQVMEAHVTRNLDFSRLPEPEQTVIFRATEANPDDRWPCSRDLVLALRQAVAATGELPLRPGELAYTGGPTPSHCADRPADDARHEPPDTDARSIRIRKRCIPAGARRRTCHRGLRLLRPKITPAAHWRKPRLSAPTARSLRPREKIARRVVRYLAGLAVIAAAAAAVIIVPKLNEKTVANVPRPSGEQPTVVNSWRRSCPLQPNPCLPTPTDSTSSWCATRLTPAISPPRSICSTKPPANCRNSKKKRCKNGYARHFSGRSIRWCSDAPTAWRWCNWKMLPAALG